jgi:methylenetetrahydrofolate--tRNA-(uracil-5-)-methyltransferase
VDLTVAYRASRRGRSRTDTGADADDRPGDYVNCPFTRDEYEAFHAALLDAEQATPHIPDETSTPFFEACIPVEELARRGPRTLAYGPMRPIGLDDPRTGRRPFAVVQLRQENREGTLWGLVGFQTRLKWADQRRVFRMIPGLAMAEFVRYGVMHRNTYLQSPSVLDTGLGMKATPGVFVAGQLTGVEGYVESAAIGILAGINACRNAAGLGPVSPPLETVLGSLCRYISETEPAHFAPMNSNHGILPPLDPRPRSRKERGQAYAERSLAALDAWLRSEGLVP